MMEAALRQYRNDMTELSYLAIVAKPKNRTPGLEALAPQFLGSTSISTEGIISTIKSWAGKIKKRYMDGWQRIANWINTLLGKFNIIDEAQKKELEDIKKGKLDPKDAKLAITGKRLLVAKNVILASITTIGSYAVYIQTKAARLQNYVSSSNSAAIESGNEIIREAASEAEHKLNEETEKYYGDGKSFVRNWAPLNFTKIGRQLLQSTKTEAEKIKKMMGSDSKVETIRQRNEKEFGTDSALKYTQYAFGALALGGLVYVFFKCFKKIRKALSKAFQWAKRKVSSKS